MPVIGAQISRQDYNALQKIVSNVWGPGGINPNTNVSDPKFGYGQILASSQIGSGSQTITEQQWDQLRVDINKAYIHQVGAASTIPDVAGSGAAGAINATRVTASQVYQPYLTAANDILNNKNLFAGSQRSGLVIVSNGTKSTTTPWSQSVSQTIEITFNSAAEARYFFNSGATINFRSSRAGGTTTPQNAAAQNNSWTAFLNTVGTQSFGRTQFYALTSSGLDASATPVFLFSASAPYSNNFYRIKANANVASNATGTATFISFLIEWIDSSVIQGIATDYIDGTLTSIISETKSTGVATIVSPLNYVIGQLSPEGTAINLSPIFTLTSNVNSVDEGGTVTFTLTSKNYPSGKSYQLQILGVTDSQLVGSTSGTKNIVTTGNDTLAIVNYAVTIRADATTNPGSSITARVTVVSDNFQAGEVLEKTVTINDTSITPTPSVSISSTTANTIQSESIDVASPSTVTVTNTGTRVLNISNISINKGSSLSEFSADFTSMSGASAFSAITVAVAQSKTFTVKFAGSTVGTQTAVVTVTSDGNDAVGGGPVAGTAKTANVSVAVVAATFGITTTPILAYTTSFASDGVTPGSTVNQTIRITNSTGNATVTLGNPAVTISGEASLVSTVTGSPNGLTIAPGAFREFQVRFAGITAPSTTSVTISIDCGTAGTKVITATVTGTQSLPQISIPTTTLTAISRPINDVSTSSFNITNTGTATLNVSTVAITGQNSFSTYTVAPTSLTLVVGATQSVTVTSRRSRIGTDPATITVTSNAPSPNNTKTVSFTMTSTALQQIVYYITTALYTGNDADIVVKLKRNSTIQSYVTGAEPNAVAYVYHKQANGVVTGIPVGTTPAQAFASKLLPRNSDGTGKVYFWAAGDLTDAWDVGISQVFAWIPVGVLDNGTQQYYQSGAPEGNKFRLEAVPNLIASASPTTGVFGGVDVYASLAGRPIVKWTIVGGFQNQPFFPSTLNVRWDEVPQSRTDNWPTTPPILDGGGRFSIDWYFPEPGVHPVAFEQTYAGVVYRSNIVTLTTFSAAYHALPSNFPAEAVWHEPNVTASSPAREGVYYKYFRTITLSPNQTYTMRGIADDASHVYINIDYRTPGVWQYRFVFDFGRYYTYPFVASASGRTRLVIDMINISGPGSTFATNPGYVALEIFQGTTKVWGTTQSQAQGY